MEYLYINYFIIYKICLDRKIIIIIEINYLRSKLCEPVATQWQPADKFYPIRSQEKNKSKNC